MAFGLWAQSGEDEPLTQIRWTRDDMIGVTESWNVDAVDYLCQSHKRFSPFLSAAIDKMEPRRRANRLSSAALMYDRTSIRDASPPTAIYEEEDEGLGEEEDSDDR